MKKLQVKKLVSAALVSVMMGAALPLSANAAANDDTMIVVSLGDSYSSGEGIPSFYGQEKSWEQKIYDEDWLAHRSTKSWPGMLEIPNVSGKLKDYNVKQTNSSKCKWYFGAVSGAETRHFSKERQVKKTYKRLSLFKTLKTTYNMPKQLDVFNKVSGDVDYVTLTVGGNDVKFEDIITTCATDSTYLHFGNGKLKLEKMMDSLWASFDTTRANIKGVYTDIQAKAGKQADIIVAGYPKLLDKDGKGVLISEKEATIVNQNVTKFNNAIKSIVNECRGNGMKIHFVDVEAEFDKDGGHQAYSDNAWINNIILLKQSEDLDQSGLGSAYSVHPNEEGAKAYARCVNAKIKEIENSKKKKSVRSVSASPVVTEAVTEIAETTTTTTVAATTSSIVDAVVTDAAEIKDIEIAVTTAAENAVEEATTTVAAEDAETEDEVLVKAAG